MSEYHKYYGYTRNRLSKRYDQLLNEKPSETKMNYTNIKINSTESAVKNIKEGNFIVGSFDGSNFSISYQPAVHSTSASARQECDRLARANPGKMYVFLQLKGAELVPQTPRMSI